MWVRPIAFLTRAPAWFSTLAALLLALGGNAATSAHWLLVPHKLCQVHGTWEHASATAETHTAPENVPTYRNAGATHEECPFATLTRPEPLIGTITPDETGQRFAEHAQSIPFVMDRQPPIPTLFFAPKHSPPARA
jgi:hypothetical protein